jgi:ribose transport system ATP-binding protein
VVRALRDQGVAILLTTHKMEEIRALADRVVILRDGGLVIDEPISAVSDDEIVTAMIGRELVDLFPELPDCQAEVVLQVNDLCLDEPGAAPISVDVRAGEIVGLAGLVGAGRTELLEAIFGVRATNSGTIRVRGKQVRRQLPSAAIAANIAFVPEDRKGAGLVLCLDVLDNASLPRLSSFSVGGVLKQAKRREQVRAATESVRLRSRGLSQTVETLSGGNQQKVAVARWLTGRVDVLLLDEPTRGVDVGARSEIDRIITDFAARGMAVVMASSDMPEILSLSHRAYVLREGRFAGMLSAAELADPLAQDQIFRLASGISDAAPFTPASPPHTTPQTRNNEI